MARPVFRFAPSPNGPLHLGHALSALVNADLAARAGGRMLLRIEDIDRTRCRPEHEQAIRDDLAWLGLRWEEPVRRQSEHFADYRAALDRLMAMGLVYPAFDSRADLRELVEREEERSGKPWPRDPDGAPLYPGSSRDVDPAAATARIARGEPYALRLDMAKALARVGGPLAWREEDRAVPADPAVWGDVVLARKEVPTSYHLSVVVDDALQRVSYVVRGMDLFQATSIHRLLQALLGLPGPHYRHHRLLLDAEGRKLSKSTGAKSLASLRAEGATPADIRRMVELA